MKVFKIYSIIVLGSAILFGCSGSRSMLNSGKVCTKHQARFGKNYTFNISTAPIAESVKGSYNLANNLANRDTVYFDATLEHINAAFLAYCLDPIGYNNELYFRYGTGRNMDIGYKNSGGSNAFDLMYQFIGSNQTFREAASDKNGFYGSVGLQYSWQKYRFLNHRMFEKAQQLFSMEMSRREITLPVIFSTSFGPEERSGCFSFGVVYTHSFVKYNVTPKNVYAKNYSDNHPHILAPVNGKVNYGAFGTFFNVKVGKRFIFFNFSLAAYYQNYGKYLLIGGNSKIIKGFTFIPSYGVQLNFLPRKKKTDTG